MKTKQICVFFLIKNYISNTSEESNGDSNYVVIYKNVPLADFVIQILTEKYYEMKFVLNYFFIFYTH